MLIFKIKLFVFLFSYDIIEGANLYSNKLFLNYISFKNVNSNVKFRKFKICQLQLVAFFSRKIFLTKL